MSLQHNRNQEPNFVRFNYFNWSYDRPWTHTNAKMVTLRSHRLGCVRWPRKATLRRIKKK